ncbi:DUF4212 domain-containing protein [Inmirania thermothiophila]|uniref:Putative solute:sodium symporter small subunit n=1 Tax=Inmirania thermothiophila TaxID=1750597 RepID=A0A3N1XSL6_9GAMM|nr:DUF4212 domain-containing protein [Inmirania thermothiophila]ROR29639.1 putative solute:sodium symporter small subunit [Inmirania thermothiophila]
MSTQDRSPQAYWRANMRLVGIHLAVWAFVSYGMAILFRGAEPGVDIGFWFAQQGSMLVFIIQIFIYAWQMNRLDREFDVHED